MKDKDAAEQHFNSQLDNMVSALDKYKQENNKIVAQKEQEVDNLQKQVKEQMENTEKGVIYINGL